MEIRVKNTADIKKKVALFCQLYSIEPSSAQICVFLSGLSDGRYRHNNLLSNDFKSLMKLHQTDEIDKPIGKLDSASIMIQINYAKFTI